MRRRKKEKTLEKSSTSSTDEFPGELGRGRSAKAAKNLDAMSRSPPQQRKRSLLGLSSMRDLVEQVQDSLTKTKQQDASSASPALAGGSAHSSAEKSSRHGAAPSAAALSAPASPAAAAAATAVLPAASAASGASTHTAAATSAVAISTIVAVAPKKKVLDLKLLPSGTSLTLRTKKQTPFNPSPSEFKARERPYAVDHQPFCGVCAAPFTLMVRRQRCQVCRESVCAQCSTDKRHVEGQKGLQRVCDICIVEGPVVDDNGMYPVGRSPAGTPIAPPRPAPSRSSSSSSSNATMGRPPPAHHHHAPALYDSAPKPRVVRDEAAASMRALRAEEDTLPKSTTTTPTSGGVGVDRTRGGGSEKGVIDSRAVRPPKSPASAVAGSLFSTPSRAALVSGSPSNRSNGVGIIGGGGGGAAKAAEFEAVSIAGATALGEEDDGDAEGGPPSSVSSSKARKRGKKARRAGTPAPEAVKTPSEKRQPFWSGGKSLSEYFGKSSGTAAGVAASAGTPLSRSSRSTPRGASAGTRNHTTNTSAFSAASGGRVGASVSANNDSGGGSSSEGNWVSITKRRPLGGGQAQTVGHGSAFVRDFIRGAGIHRLDPRRLAGPLAVCASRTGLDKLWAGLRVLLLWLLEIEGEPTRGGGGRSRRSGGARGGHGHYQHQIQNAAASRGWRPGRRFLFVGSLALVACYRRYQVTHPELTTEHVLREASSLLFALTLFFAHAVTDLPRDACGAIVPSLCGTRESRLQAARDRASSLPPAGMASPDAAAGSGLARAGAGAGFRLAEGDDWGSDCGGDVVLNKREREEDGSREGWARGSNDGGLVEGGGNGGSDSEVV
ncbi:unnamed protein product [Ascophyllum nodosum]